MTLPHDPRWQASPGRRFARMTIVFLALVTVFGLLVGAGAWLLRSSLTQQVGVSAPRS